MTYCEQCWKADGKICLNSPRNSAPFLFPFCRTSLARNMNVSFLLCLAVNKGKVINFTGCSTLLSTLPPKKGRNLNILLSADTFWKQTLKRTIKDIHAHCYCAFFRACHALVMHPWPRKLNKHGIEAQTFSRRMECKSMWHHGIAVDPVWIDNRVKGISF